MSAKIKLKTKRAAHKRFSITGTGKVKRNRAFSKHILTKKSSERKRKFRQSALVKTAGDIKRVKSMLPYN